MVGYGKWNVMLNQKISMLYFCMQYLIVKFRMIIAAVWKWNFCYHFDCFLILLIDGPFAVFLNIIYSHVCTGNWFFTWNPIKRMHILINSANMKTFCPRISKFYCVDFYCFFAAGSPEDTILKSEVIYHISLSSCIGSLNHPRAKKIFRCACIYRIH